MVVPDKIWAFTYYREGREQDPTTVFYKYEPNQYVNDHSASQLLRKTFLFLGKKRSSAKQSVLTIKHAENEESETIYYLLTLEKDVLTARTYKFSLDGEELKENCIEEKVLLPPDEIDMTKFKLRDFKVQEQNHQYHVLLRLTDGYRSETAKNFALLTFSTYTGGVESLNQFNLGGEKI